MVKDIAPELIEKVQKAFTKKYQSSPKIKGALEVINKGEATYKNASAFAEEVGDLLAKTFQEEIGTESLPDGRMYYNIADRLLNNTLGKNYDLISSYTKDTQKVLNEKAGIGVKPAVPEINQSRIDHMVERIAEEEDYDKIKWMLDEPVTNFSMSVVDDFVKKNVKLHYDMGLHPKIVRKETGKCCDWCKEVVGSYDYPDDVPEDVYKRHRYCRCTVEYFPGNGKKQDVWSKKWEDEDKEEKLRRRISFSEAVDRTAIPKFSASLEITERIRSGEISKKYNQEHFDKHVRGTKHYEAYRLSRQKKGWGPRAG